MVILLEYLILNLNGQDNLKFILFFVISSYRSFIS